MLPSNIALRTTKDTWEVAGVFREDVLALALRSRNEVERHKAGEIELDEVAFWLKALARAFLAHVDGLSALMRDCVKQFPQYLGQSLSRKQEAELSHPAGPSSFSRGVSVAFRLFPRLFRARYEMDTSSSDFQTFQLLCAGRERFTHPKSAGDLYPWELLLSLQPAMEWFLIEEMRLLIACGSAAGLHLERESLPERRFPFSRSRAEGFRQLAPTLDAAFTDLERGAYSVEMVRGLEGDTLRAVRLVRESQTSSSLLSQQCAVRALYRDFFTEVEGCLFAAKRAVDPDYDPEVAKQLLIGNDEAVLRNVVAALEACATTYGSPRTIPLTDAGWAALIRCRGIRNRATHPRKLADLLTAGLALYDIILALRWFRAHASPCFDPLEES